MFLNTYYLWLNQHRWQYSLSDEISVQLNLLLDCGKTLRVAKQENCCLPRGKHESKLSQNIYLLSIVNFLKCPVCKPVN